MFAEAPRPSGRRSKLEITCDILSVISKGTEKPTRIMQLANVTWDDLIMYLEALIRNQLLSRHVDGKRVTYSLTDRGSALLDNYLKLKREAAPLKLETLTKERISKALTFLPTIGAQESDLYSKLQRRLKAEGRKILSPKIVGKSGAVHTLGIVAEQKDGARHGYVVVRAVDETQVMKLFVTQLDTELVLHALYSGELSQKAADLARAYSLELLPWEGTETKTTHPGGEAASEVDVLRFAGKSLLLEVDPAVSYEVIVKEFARAFKSSKSAVFAFTWMGGPIYGVLSSIEGVQIFSMTSQATYPRQTGQGAEVLVPHDDPAVLLDLTANAFQANGNRKALMVFDSISDLIVSLGFEKAYAFLKSQKEILAKEPDATALFVAKRNAQDERVMSLIRGLFADHLSYGASGLAVTRAMQGRQAENR
ncbi:MAG TPA: winged helix-turn-helix domain-containing protein [Nitrososphaerales archaeon]|nr:winged helix-turn-helix domain-containing protein [Nitrososphaerales archaeon]